MAKFVICAPDFKTCPSNHSCAGADEKQKPSALHNAVLYRNTDTNLFSVCSGLEMSSVDRALH